MKTAHSKTKDCKLKYKVTCYKANHKTIESDSLLRHSGHVWYILSHKGNSYHAVFIRLKTRLKPFVPTSLRAEPEVRPRLCPTK